MEWFIVEPDVLVSSTIEKVEFHSVIFGKIETVARCKNIDFERLRVGRDRSIDRIISELNIRGAEST